MANEAAAMSSAFQSEAIKVVAEFPQTLPADRYETQVIRHRLVQKLGELVTYYVSRLACHVWIPQLLELGLQLQERSEYAVAYELCYKKIMDLKLPDVAVSEKLTENTKLSWHTQAQYGAHYCQAAVMLSADPHMLHEATLVGSLQELSLLRAACMQAAAVEELYWLVHNGTILIYKFAHQLATAGFSLAALPYFVFCAKAMESSIALSNACFLPWRVQLYAAAAQCYSSLLHHAPHEPNTASSTSSSTSSQLASALEQAQLFLTSGVEQIDHLMKLYALDPVPPPPESIRTCQAAKAHLLAARMTAEGTPTPILAKGTPVPTTPAAAASPSSSLQDVLKALPADQDKLAALIRILEASGCLLQPLHQQQTIPAHLQPAIEASKALISRLLPEDWAAFLEGNSKQGAPGATARAGNQG
jgi:hypothetical protein